jgi:hypothetical protein
MGCKEARAVGKHATETESDGCKEGRILSVIQSDFRRDQEMHLRQTRGVKVGITAPARAKF